MEQQEKKKFYKKWWVWVIGIVVLLAIIGSGSESEKSTATNDTSEPKTTVQKQYVEVAKFSGNGIKKSEPFTVSGDRFKIAYDCKGDPSATLCTAFVYKVGSNLPQGVMNSAQATKDETIIYTSMAGKGDYYIDANVMGNFSMVVYDYK